MVKASGGRGMRPIESEDKLLDSVLSAKREAKAAFGKDEVFLEKLVRRTRHVKVQILGDTNGNLVHLFKRNCSIQRRNQKVIERAPAPYLDDKARRLLCEAALKIGKAARYASAGRLNFCWMRTRANFISSKSYQSAHPGRTHGNRKAYGS